MGSQRILSRDLLRGWFCQLPTQLIAGLVAVLGLLFGPASGSAATKAFLAYSPGANSPTLLAFYFSDDDIKSFKLSSAPTERKRQRVFYIQLSKAGTVLNYGTIMDDLSSSNLKHVEKDEWSILDYRFQDFKSERGEIKAKKNDTLEFPLNGVLQSPHLVRKCDSKNLICANDKVVLKGKGGYVSTALGFAVLPDIGEIALVRAAADGAVARYTVLPAKEIRKVLIRSCKEGACDSLKSSPVYMLRGHLKSGEIPLFYQFGMKGFDEETGAYFGPINAQSSRTFSPGTFSVNAENMPFGILTGQTRHFESYNVEVLVEQLYTPTAMLPVRVNFYDEVSDQSSCLDRFNSDANNAVQKCLAMSKGQDGIVCAITLFEYSFQKKIPWCSTRIEVQAFRPLAPKVID